MPVPRRVVKDSEAQHYLDDLSTETERIKQSWSGPEPTNPVKGQLWYDETTETLYVYTEDPVNASANFGPIQSGLDLKELILLDSAANSFTGVGSLIFPKGGSTVLYLDLTSPLDNTYPQLGKIYHVSVNDPSAYGSTVYRILPVDDRGPDGSDDFELIVTFSSVSTTIMSANFFVRRTGGSSDIALTARCRPGDGYDSWLDTSDSFGTDATASSGDINNYLARQTDISTPTWSSYTPTWTATSVNPSIGDGTLVGRYSQAGKIVHFNIKVTWGSTTSDGTGEYQFSLPVTASSNAPVGLPVNTNVLDGGSWTSYGGGHIATTTRIDTIVDPGIVTLDTGDAIVIEGTYEAA